ncbi:hypothetical protein BC835DRAFT_1314582 [Cytidiella melzeri]|nr:hypothetical protein BC835DRAFT_1314582 [Cytidiella melzeri]
MNRLPPSLLYLTIYNPTLKPASSVSSDVDEDAEEQAHILFYTSRERAVSRDKILRQVGLSKALVNFASMFNAADICESTHSQSRRMIMVSPEPAFWIHACVELAKTPRQAKAKPTAKGKGQEDAAPQAAGFEYHDGSVQDAALREQILNAYQQFKLTHGSFSSILSLLGQAALELQLERFFTVWAWQWDFEDGVEFGEQLGVPLHQEYYKDVMPVIDHFVEQYIPNHIAFVLNPPFLLPSTALLDSHYPAALSRYVMQRIPPPPPPSVGDSADADFTAVQDTTVAINKDSNTEKKTTEGTKVMSNPFANMDVRNLKWMWTGLTFGKGSSSKSTTPAVTTHFPPSENLPLPQEQEAEGNSDLSRPETETEIDTESLQDAIESENVHLSSRSSPACASAAALVDTPADRVKGSGIEDDNASHYKETGEAVVVATENVKGVEYGLMDDIASSHNTYDPKESVSEAETQDALASPLTARPPSEHEPPPTFLSAPVYLEDPGSQEHSTTRKRVFHATKGFLTFAFVGEENQDVNLDSLAEHVAILLDDVNETLHAAHERESQGSVLTVTKILEPQDTHILSTGAYTLSSTGFSSSSEQLFAAREVLRSDLDVVEVFSRGQNPQHWHLGRRNLDIAGNVGSAQGEVYMEVARKENTLTDVDNRLASVVNRFSGQC